MGSGGGGNQTTVSVEKPWDLIKPYLSNPKTQQAQDPLGMSSGIYDQVFYEYMPHVWDQMTALGEQGQDPYSLFYWNGNQLTPEQQEQMNLQGGRVAGFTQDQQDAMDLTRGIAMNSGSYVDPSKQQMLNLLNNQGKGMTEIENTWNSLVSPTVQGEYLNPESNTYLKQYVDAAQRPLIENYTNNIVPTWNNQAVASGRYGSGAWQQGQVESENALNKSLGDVSANIYAPAYENERTRQMDAAKYAPTVYEMLAKIQQGSVNPLMDTLGQEYQNAGYLASLGEAEQGMNQSTINALMQQYQDQLYGPTDWANVLANMFMSGGALGRTSEQTSPYAGPTLGQTLLGTGTSIASILNDVGAFS